MSGICKESSATENSVKLLAENTEVCGIKPMAYLAAEKKIGFH